jgi:hypothetical protein
MINLANSRQRHRGRPDGRKLVPLLLGAVVGLAPVAASAHHSHAMFDPDKTLTVEGTVKSFQYTNPHMWLFLIVKDDKGQEVNFPIEGTNIQGAGRMGIIASTFKPGDKVSLLINPYRDGRPGGSWREATDARGVLHKPARGGD